MVRPMHIAWFDWRFCQECQQSICSGSPTEMHDVCSPFEHMSCICAWRSLQ